MWFYFSKILINQSFNFFLVNISWDDKGSIVRSVEMFIICLYIFEGSMFKISHFSNHFPAVRMIRGIKIFINNIIGKTVRSIIFSLSFFVWYYVLLDTKGMLCNWINKIPHSIGFKPQYFSQCIFWKHFKISGYIPFSKTIIVAPDAFNDLIKSSGRDVFRTAKKQMFKQVGKTGLAWYFPAWANMIHYGIWYDGIGMISMKNYLQTVRHCVLLIIYFKCIGLWSHRTGCAD